MSSYGIIVNIDKCVGCHACAIACKEENQVAPGIFYDCLKYTSDAADEYTCVALGGRRIIKK